MNKSILSHTVACVTFLYIVMLSVASVQWTLHVIPYIFFTAIFGVIWTIGTLIYENKDKEVYHGSPQSRMR